MRKKKLLIFHPALAPYRIDQFNLLNEIFDLQVVFLYDNLWTFKYDQDLLLSQCKFKISFLLKGFSYKGKVFRFGMFRKIKEHKPDIVLGYEYSISTQYLLLLKKTGLINPIIGSMTDDSIDICHNVQSKARRIARKQTVNRLDFIVVMSNEISLYYQSEFDFDPNRIIVSPILQLPEKLRGDAFNLERIALKYVEKYDLKNKKILLFVGRLIPEKALILFLNNVYTVLQNKNDLKLIIVGEGNERILLENFIHANNLQESVLLIGRLEGVELHAWYLCASGFVLPSLSEAFGAVVNESLIFGLPVFCSMYAGASCLINNMNGMIFNPKDKEKTIEDLKIFLSKIEVVENITLSSKPTLMDDFKNSFNKEWSKLLTNLPSHF